MILEPTITWVPLRFFAYFGILCFLGMTLNSSVVLIMTLNSSGTNKKMIFESGSICAATVDFLY